MIRFPGALLVRVPRPRTVDLVLLAGMAALLYAFLAAAPGELRRAGPSVTIDLRPEALPGYAWLSLLRLTAAYVLSLLFTIVYGYAAARNAAAQKWLIPLLDILQSIPVLSFLPTVLLAMVALFPQRAVGLEIGSILLIFTGMVWNMTFSFYHSLLTIPEDLLAAARLLRLSWWQRFTTLELPGTVIGLVWNSMMSWAGGWFFLMACEAFTLANHSFMLPGLGSYLALASGNGNTRAMLWGLGVLIAVIVVLDQLMWRPLIAWSQRFKMELSDDPNAARSWMLDLLRRSRIIGAAQHRVGIPVAEALDRAGAHRAAAMPPGGRPLARAARSGRLLFAAAILAMAGWGAFLMLRLLAGVAPVEWLRLTVDAGATLLRVAVALLLAIGWTVPVGMAIGLRPRLARVAQPIAQVAASVPATALFPIVLLLLLRAGGGLNLASVLLMLLGTQWYVLFNVIAGATAIPRDLIEAASLTKIRGWMLWRTLLLPAIFPFLVTGMLTAQGGAFNASIVSEYVVFGGRILRTTGLGATIAAAANSGNYSLLAASTVALATVVVLLNSLIWRRAAHLAEERYHV